MSNFKLTFCKSCGNEFKQYNSLQKCRCKFSKPQPNLKLKSPKPIKKVSDKMKVLNAKYSVLRIEFLGKLENKICPVTKEATTEVHHMKGRKGFADEWAKENNIPLLIDVRFFLAVSRKGHIKIELNPEWAKENNYSLNRLN